MKVYPFPTRGIDKRDNSVKNGLLCSEKGSALKGTNLFALDANSSLYSRLLSLNGNDVMAIKQEVTECCLPCQQ